MLNCIIYFLGAIRGYKSKHFEDRSQPFRFVEYMVGSTDFTLYLQTSTSLNLYTTFPRTETVSSR